MAGASDVTLTAAEALHGTHKYTGTLTGNINVIVPASERRYRIWNATSGAFTLTVKTSAGTGVLIPQGSKSIVVCDGTNVENWLTHLLGGELFLDADLDTSITADTDDRIDFKVQGQDLFRMDGTVASAVNGLDFVAAVTGSPARLKAQGSDSDIGIDIVAKAAKGIAFYSDALELFKIAYVASAVNFLQVEPSAAGNPAKLAAFGDDTNVGIAYQPKGAGAHDFLTGALNANKGSDIASATTTDIGAATGNFVDITGTTTITGLGTVKAGTTRKVQFDGALTLTHNASSLILPGGANITTAAGDVAEFVSLGGGNWICTNYQRADGSPLAKQWSLLTTLDTTSGAEAETTAIPSTATMIRVLLDNVSGNGTNQPQLELGATSYANTCNGHYSRVINTTVSVTAVSGGPIILGANVSAGVGWRGMIDLTKMDDNNWLWSYVTEHSSAEIYTGTGIVDLSATLDRLKLSWTGANNFDAGAAPVWVYS